MNGAILAKTHSVRRYRATLAALMGVLTVAIWPGLLFPLARAYAEFSFQHPFTTPFLDRYPPFVVAALLLWTGPVLLVALSLALRQLVGEYRLERRATRRRVQPTGKWLELARSAGIDDRLVVVADRAPYAFCAGFRRPTVYVSSRLLAMLSRAEIEAVLRHEASHLRRRDPLRLFLVDLAHVVLAPFPVIETFCDRVRIGIELAADRAALAIVPMPALAGAVLKVARASTSTMPHTVANLSASQARIDALLGRPVQIAFTRRDLFLTGIVLLTVGAVVAHLASIPLCPICPTI